MHCQHSRISRKRPLAHNDDTQESPSKRSTIITSDHRRAPLSNITNEMHNKAYPTKVAKRFQWDLERFPHLLWETCVMPFLNDDDLFQARTLCKEMHDFYFNQQILQKGKNRRKMNMKRVLSLASMGRRFPRVHSVVVKRFRPTPKQLNALGPEHFPNLKHLFIKPRLSISALPPLLPTLESLQATLAQHGDYYMLTETRMPKLREMWIRGPTRKLITLPLKYTPLRAHSKLKTLHLTCNSTERLGHITPNNFPVLSKLILSTDTAPLFTLPRFPAHFTDLTLDYICCDWDKITHERFPNVKRITTYRGWLRNGSYLGPIMRQSEVNKLKDRLAREGIELLVMS